MVFSRARVQGGSEGLYQFHVTRGCSSELGNSAAREVVEFPSDDKIRLRKPPKRERVQRRQQDKNRRIQR